MKTCPYFFRILNTMHISGWFVVRRRTLSIIGILLGQQRAFIQNFIVSYTCVSGIAGQWADKEHWKKKHWPSAWNRVSASSKRHQVYVKLVEPDKILFRLPRLFI